MNIRKPGSLEPSKVGSQESQQMQPSPKQSDQLGAEGIAQVSDALESVKLPDAFNSAFTQAVDPRQAIHQEPSKTQKISSGEPLSNSASSDGQESGSSASTKVDVVIGEDF